jgi:hypothetical protein
MFSLPKLSATDALSSARSLLKGAGNRLHLRNPSGKKKSDGGLSTDSADESAHSAVVGEPSAVDPVWKENGEKLDDIFLNDGDATDDDVGGGDIFDDRSIISTEAGTESEVPRFGVDLTRRPVGGLGSIVVGAEGVESEVNTATLDRPPMGVPKDSLFDGPSITIGPVMSARSSYETMAAIGSPRTASSFGDAGNASRLRTNLTANLAPAEALYSRQVEGYSLSAIAMPSPPPRTPISSRRSSLRSTNGISSRDVENREIMDFVLSNSDRKDSDKQLLLSSMDVPCEEELIKMSKTWNSKPHYNDLFGAVRVFLIKNNFDFELIRHVCSFELNGRSVLNNTWFINYRDTNLQDIDADHQDAVPIHLFKMLTALCDECKTTMMMEHIVKIFLAFKTFVYEHSPAKYRKIILSRVVRAHADTTFYGMLQIFRVSRNRKMTPYKYSAISDWIGTLMNIHAEVENRFKEDLYELMLNRMLGSLPAPSATRRVIEEEHAM